jgi:cell division initiation protein
MRITPLDIRKHSFPRRLNGYDRDEVDAFLQMLAGDYEGLVRETERLRKQVVQLETRVKDLSANEAVLQDTLTIAQKLAEDLKRTAMKEAEVTVSEAEIKGEKILDAAHRRAAKLAEDIREMKSLKVRLAAALRATIETHLGLLEGLAVDPAEERAAGHGPQGPSRGDRKPRPGA